MSAARLTAGFIADATNGSRHDCPVDLVCTGIATDTRRPMRGACFVALRGPRHDAHDHLERAVGAGAAVALVSRADARPAGLPLIVVPDTRAALGQLAAAWRDTLRGPVISVTGSVGKTTCKELLRSVLAARGPVSAAPSSWNNDIGLPLTLLGATDEHDAVVTEIGTGRPGEIQALSSIARADLAMITAVGRAHLGAFGSVDAIATEKASITAPMDEDAPVVANRDAPHLVDRLRQRADVVWYGRHSEAAVRLIDSGVDDDGPWCAIDRGSGVERFRLRLQGEHNALNACGVVAVAGALGRAGLFVPDDALRRGLAEAEPPAMRLSVREVGGIHVHDDSWNASPESMAAAIRTFDATTRVPAAAGAGRVLILGDMLELGPDAPRLHREIGELVSALDLAAPFARLILVGRHAPLIGAGRDLAARAVLLERLDEFAESRVLEHVRPGDHVLLKGSRGVGLDRVADWIERRATAETG